MSFNPWHDVSIGESAPEVVRSIIEIPKDTRTKYELDKESGMLIMDRYLYSSVSYPQNYGFIPGTYCDDKDPLDILVLSQAQIVPMCLVEAKVIGVLHMEDGGEQDDKIIAVAASDFSLNHMNDLNDVPDYVLNEMKVFFEDYKKLEKKHVVVEAFKGREAAIEIVKASMEAYREKFGK